MNGVTSAGKTSIVEAIQERDDVFFYVVANDLMAKNIEYRLRVDTSLCSLAECAEIIVKELFSKGTDMAGNQA